MTSYILALLGGALIGIAVSLMLLWNGRVAGVSGIVNGTLKPAKSDFGWRFAFIAGLVSGGLLLSLFFPESLSSELDRSLGVIAVAGLLVGFGTVMGNGCTSGHGICGLSRLSPRSIVATLTFMFFGILAATLFRQLTEGQL
jgi:hypothetical protein